MKIKAFNILPILIAILALTACSPTRHQMPITTSSEEARELFIKARDLHENYREEDADTLLEKAVNLDPDFALAHLWRYNDVGVQDACNLIEKVSPGESLMIRAYNARANDNFPLCKILVDSLHGLHPKDKHCLFFAGLMWSSYDEIKAIDFYKKALKRDKFYAAPYIRMAVLMKRLNMYDDVNESYLKYFDLRPGTGASLVAFGNYLLEVDNDMEALIQYKTALKVEPDYFFSYWYIIWTYIRMGQYNDAMKYCEQFYNSGIPSNDNIDHFRFDIKNMSLGWMATVQFVQHNYDRTMIFLDSLIQTNRNENDFRGLLWAMNIKSWYQMEADQPDSANNTLSGTLVLIEEVDEDMETRESGLLWTYGTMSVLYGNVGKLEKAEEYLDKARILYDNKHYSDRDKNFMTVFEAAFAICQGDYDLAISHVEIEANKSYVLSRYYLAKAYELSGNIDGAMKYYKLLCDIVNPYHTGLVYNKCKERLAKINQ